MCISVCNYIGSPCHKEGDIILSVHQKNERKNMNKIFANVPSSPLDNGDTGVGNEFSFKYDYIFINIFFLGSQLLCLTLIHIASPS